MALFLPHFLSFLAALAALLLALPSTTTGFIVPPTLAASSSSSPLSSSPPPPSQGPISPSFRPAALLHATTSSSLPPSTSTTPYEEILIPLPDGLVVAAKAWGPATGPPVLALHGWLDNANTFDRLAPSLAAAGLRVICIDFPGHGKSAHRSPDAVYAFTDYVYYVWALAKQLKWKKFQVLGHSLGAGIGLALAGTYPEMVERIVCVETLGIISKPAESAPTTLREAIRQRATLVEVMRKGLGKEKEGGREGGRGVGSKVYATVEEAVEARLSTVGRLPGAQTLEPSSAAILVGRGAGPAKAPHASDLVLHEVGREGGVRFRHDQRLAASAHIYLTEEQSRAFLAASRCPVLLLRGAEGWPAASPEEEIMREAALGERLTMLKVPGSHHLHLDQSTCTEEGVIKPVVAFLSEGAGVQA